MTEAFGHTTPAQARSVIPARRANLRAALVGTTLLACWTAAALYALFIVRSTTDLALQAAAVLAAMLVGYLLAFVALRVDGLADKERAA